MTREELENKMAVLLGGRAAELIVFGHLSTGAADDLRRVTDIARSMVTRYGMSEKLGNVAYERDTALLPGRPRSAIAAARARLSREETGDAIDDEVRAIVRRRARPHARHPARAARRCSNARPGGCSRRKRSTRPNS